MLNKENTEKVLNDWGADIVKFAKINIGDRSRTRKSKITGKTRKGKIDSSGDMRDSLDHSIVVHKNSFGFQVTGVDYTSDVDLGTKRKTSVNAVKNWMKAKPVRLTSKKGFIKMTPARIDNFAKFVAWKVSTIGSDATYFFTDAVTDASKKWETQLTESLFKDVEQSTSFILRQLNNG